MSKKYNQRFNPIHQNKKKLMRNNKSSKIITCLMKPEQSRPNQDVWWGRVKAFNSAFAHTHTHTDRSNSKRSLAVSVLHHEYSRGFCCALATPVPNDSLRETFSDALFVPTLHSTSSSPVCAWGSFLFSQWKLDYSELWGINSGVWPRVWRELWV